MFTKQFGVSPGKFTQYANMALINEINKGIADSIPTLCIFVELEKTFDTVSHLELLEVLIGIDKRGIPYNLQGIYLRGRKYRVEFENIEIDFSLLEYGNLQCNVLGPGQYLNDLFDLESKGEIVSLTTWQ